MIPVTSDKRNYRSRCWECCQIIYQSMTPDREVITFVPEEFRFVSGTFRISWYDVKVPFGNAWTSLHTGPRTILHNLRKTVERWVRVDNVIISPLGTCKLCSNEGEREFGGLLLIWAGQTRLGTIRNQELHHTTIYQEGGDYVTKDISKFLKLLRRTQKVWNLTTVKLIHWSGARKRTKTRCA